MTTEEQTTCPNCQGTGEMFTGVYGFDDQPVLETCFMCDGIGVIAASLVQEPKTCDVEKLYVETDTNGG